jgi:ubiquinone/menaquinone biosynthesis C-methylase UbiE
MADFAQQYHELRKLEGRFYTDAQVAQLPKVPASHQHHSEWKIREIGANEVLRMISQAGSAPIRILDLGCGNGWFSAMLANLEHTSVLGIDLPGEELEQAQRVWEPQLPNLQFLGGDIFSLPLEEHSFDFITLGASYQYFPDLAMLVGRLRGLLKEGAQIIVFDSPVYPENACAKAKERTQKYYSEMGFPALASFYHHHSWEKVQALGGKQAKSAPGKWEKRISGLFSKAINPFPILVFSKTH